VPRILHAPFDVAGQAFGLSRAERKLGLTSDVAVFTPSPYGYGFDIDIGARPTDPLWRQFSRRLSYLRRAAEAYDVFHFNFGQTILSIRRFGHVVDELAWLRRRGKTILFTYQGSDVRPSDHCPCERPECRHLDRYRHLGARRALRFADRVFYQNPDLRQWLPGASFLPYAAVDPSAIRPEPLPERKELVVVHAPTDRVIKGTRHVVEAVDALREEGVAIRLDLVEGVSREVALQRLARADLLVDQLMLGWYGTVAVEAMALGRPVMAYIREDEPEDNPFGPELPVVRTTPATLAVDLRALAADRDRRRELGVAGRSFVEQHHDPVALARTALDGLVAVPAG
jgi:glycosyltransferase involved in cell wall biosynthesis